VHCIYHHHHQSSASYAAAVAAAAVRQVKQEQPGNSDGQETKVF